MPVDVHALEELDTLGVSLVRRGANKKTFALFKSEGSRMDQSQISVLKAVLEDDAPLENADRIEAVIKSAGVSTKAGLALKGAMKIMEAFKDEMDEGAMKAFSEMFPGEKPDEEEEKKAAEDEDAKDEEAEKAKKAEDAKDEEDTEKQEKAEMSKSEDPTLKALWKSQKEAVAKAEKLEAILKAERDERLRRDFVAKAEREYANLPANAAELGLILKTLHDVAPEAAAKMEAVLKASSEAITNSPLFAEAGSAAASTGGSSWAKIEEVAKSMVAKGEGKLSHADAIVKAMDANPELYQAYLSENPAQTGRRG